MNRPRSRTLLRLTIGLLFAFASLFPGNLEAQLFYSTNNGLITITGYNGTQTTISIPTSINDHPVNAIGDYAFMGNQTLVEIQIPNGVESIGASAFANCSSLQTAALPPSIAGIGDGAFTGCTSLKNISIPLGITSIAVGTFSHSGLTNIFLPPSITRIWNEAFYECQGLTSFQFPSTVTNIGSFAFDDCTNLLKVTLPASLKNMGTAVFSRCYQLSEVVIPPGAAVIGDEAFTSCTSLSRIVIPASVTNVGDYAFATCVALKGIYFLGNAPQERYRVFYNDYQAIVYYMPNTSGWTPFFDGRPTMLWNPQAQTSDSGFGFSSNRFGFNITGTANLPIVIEASSPPDNSAWIPLQTCTLTNGSLHFTDPAWTNFPTRFYRIRSP